MLIQTNRTLAVMSAEGVKCVTVGIARPFDPLPMAQPTASAQTPAAEAAYAHDLTQKMAPFMDVHLLLQVLDHLQEKKVHPAGEILRARLELLKPTKMVDYMLEQYRELHQADPPAELSGRRDAVVAEIKRLGTACGRLHAMVEPGEGEAEARRLIDADEFNRETLREDYEVEDSNIEALYAYAKCRMDCGDYAQARRALDFFIRLSRDGDSRRMSATWGLLAAALLDGETGVALAQARVLQGMIDKSGSSPLMQLQQRSWLLHWSLFLAFSDEAGRSFFLDLCFHREGGHGRDRDRGNEYMAALQNNCPWLARYLVVAVFTAPQKTRRSLLKPLVRAVTLVAHEHRDPITDFVAALHEDVDFAAAGDALRHCEPLLRSDFFLSLNAGTAGQFIENARVSVAETFCRVHARVSVSVVAEILGVDAAQASQLLDAALRQSKIDGEVNDEKGQVSVNVRYPTLADVVHERVKDVEHRTERTKAVMETGIA